MSFSGICYKLSCLFCHGTSIHETLPRLLLQVVMAAVDSSITTAIIINNTNW